MKRIRWPEMITIGVTGGLGIGLIADFVLKHGWESLFGGLLASLIFIVAIGSCITVKGDR